MICSRVLPPTTAATIPALERDETTLAARPRRASSFTRRVRTCRTSLRSAFDSTMAVLARSEAVPVPGSALFGLTILRPSSPPGSPLPGLRIFRPSSASFNSGKRRAKSAVRSGRRRRKTSKTGLRRASSSMAFCCCSAIAFSLDHIVSDGEDPRRQGKTKDSRCLEIDNELEFGRPQHWQVGGRPSPEKTPDVDAGLTISVLDIGSVSHEPTRIGVLARLVNRGDGMTCCQADDMLAPTVKKWIGAHDEPINSQSDKSCKSRVELAITAGVHPSNLKPEHASGRLQVSRLIMRLCVFCGGIQQHADCFRLRQQIAQQSQLVRVQLGQEKMHASDVAARSVETGNEAKFDRISAACEDDWDRRCGSLCGQCRRRSSGRDDYHLTPHQFGCQLW